MTARPLALLPALQRLKPVRLPVSSLAGVDRMVGRGRARPAPLLCAARSGGGSTLSEPTAESWEGEGSAPGSNPIHLCIVTVSPFLPPPDTGSLYYDIEPESARHLSYLLRFWHLICHEFRGACFSRSGSPGWNQI
jgi:hypothetical protein